MKSTLKNRQLNEEIHRLSRTDNYTNFFHLAGIYLFLALGFGGALGFYHYRYLQGFSIWWNIPVTLLAIVWMGVAQHRLGGLAHDALHHLMFKNRYLNEWISDCFCMFPIFSITYFFRLEHLGHHQSVNDPETDPDMALLQESGYWLEGPVPKKQLRWEFLKLLNIPALIRYMAIRSKYASLFYSKHAFRRKDAKASSIYIYNALTVVHLVGMFLLMTVLVWRSDAFLLKLLPFTFWLLFFGLYLSLPGDVYRQSHFHPVISLRVLSLMRMTFITALFWGLGWISYSTSHWVILYFFLLWIVPMFTVFSFLTILQQGVQHANADRGWLTNSRIFVLNPVVEFCLFPFGLGYHQPHHMFPSVPHYRLKKLHQILSRVPEYRDHATVVQGYLFSPLRGARKYPTVVEGLGPEYSPQNGRDIYVDNSVLENDRVDKMVVTERVP